MQKIDGMRYHVTRLPKYLIIHLRRFTKNDFFVEKNPTLVNFPVKNLDLKDHMTLPTQERLCSKYDLIANVVHDVEEASNRRFCLGVQSDPAGFMSWFLKALHADLISYSKTTSSIIHECFQGELAVVKDTHVRDGASTKMKFLMLGLDLPTPLFNNAKEQNKEKN
nr:U4/U6.U5 tri-snRNP-associated protein 2-like [Tanacetum cinerariifolium]